MWKLESGTWEVGPGSQGFIPSGNSDGTPISNNLLDSHDWKNFISYRHKPDTFDALFPPEFEFCPETGERLSKNSESDFAAWVPPFGADPVSSNQKSRVRGLQQTRENLAFASIKQLRADSDADVTLMAPPPGEYFFFSCKLATSNNVLLALEPEKGALFVYLPNAEKWEPLELKGNGILSECPFPRLFWSCEVHTVGQLSYIFIPTQDGLAVVTPDLLSMTYKVLYLGDGASCLGAPVFFSDRIYVPLLSNDGNFQFLNCSLTGSDEQILYCPQFPKHAKVDLRQPIADARMCLWIGSQGQWIVRKTTLGLEPQFIPWSSNVEPVFNFGCPYLSRDGGLWQLDYAKDTFTYVYLKLGQFNASRAEAESPRTCSGQLTFRLASKYAIEPWIPPEQGDDAGVSQLVIPILESSRNSSVLGLQIETSSSIVDLLETNARVRATLVLDNSDAQIGFFTFAVAEPWKIRFSTTVRLPFLISIIFSFGTNT
jgi:hypothetical protein